jgi:N-methylhydantoinase A
VATSNLAAEFTRLVAKKGIDPREFTLVPFGGAGATHACLLAEDVHIQHIAIPYSPGTFCATGSVLADFRLDYVQSVYSSLEKMDQSAVDAWVRDVESRARATLADAAGEVESIHTVRTADVRYAGQGYEVSVPYERLDELNERFRKEYVRLYGPRIDEAPLEVISIRATVIGVSRKVAPGWAGGTGGNTRKSARRIELDGRDYECPVYVRSEMPPGWDAAGPFIVDQPDTTCIVTSGWHGKVDAIGTLHLTRES